MGPGLGSVRVVDVDNLAADARVLDDIDGVAARKANLAAGTEPSALRSPRGFVKPVVLKTPREVSFRTAGSGAAVCASSLGAWITALALCAALSLSRLLAAALLRTTAAKPGTLVETESSALSASMLNVE